MAAYVDFFQIRKKKNFDFSINLTQHVSFEPTFLSYCMKKLMETTLKHKKNMKFLIYLNKIIESFLKNSVQS